MTTDLSPQADTRKPDENGKIRGALTRYRVLAWITGVWLLLLVVEMVLKYIVFQFFVDGELGDLWRFVPIVHGWVYMIYLLVTLDLAIKVRWPWPKTILTLLAGTIPFLSFWFENRRTEDVKSAYRV